LFRTNIKQNNIFLLNAAKTKRNQTFNTSWNKSKQPHIHIMRSVMDILFPTFIFLFDEIHMSNKL